MRKKRLTIKDIDTEYASFGILLNFIFTREEEEGIFYAHWLDVSKTGENIYWVNKVSREILSQAEAKEVTILELMTHEGNTHVEIWNCMQARTKVMSINKAVEKYKDSMPQEDSYLL